MVKNLISTKIHFKEKKNFERKLLQAKNSSSIFFKRLVIGGGWSYIGFLQMSINELGCVSGGLATSTIGDVWNREKSLTSCPSDAAASQQ